MARAFANGGRKVVLGDELYRLYEMSCQVHGWDKLLVIERFELGEELYRGVCPCKAVTLPERLSKKMQSSRVVVFGIKLTDNDLESGAALNPIRFPASDGTQPPEKDNFTNRLLFVEI